MDNTYDAPEANFKKDYVYEYCEYEGHLVNQGIRMCSCPRPNKADILKCGKDCPEYKRKVIESTMTCATYSASTEC